MFCLKIIYSCRGKAEFSVAITLVFHIFGARLSSVLIGAQLLGLERRWCEDPIVIAQFLLILPKNESHF